MAKKTIASDKLTQRDVIEALSERNMLRLTPPVRITQKATWDALVGLLLLKRCDVIVRKTDKSGSRYERIRASATHAKMTLQLNSAVMEYIIRSNSPTPNWCNDD